MNLRTAAALVLLAIGLIGVPDLGPKASISVKEPSSDMKTAVQPVVRIVSKMSPLDRLWLQQIYTNFSKVVSVDGLTSEPTITSTDSLRAVHLAVLKFIWKGMADNQPGKYEGLSEAIDECMGKVISDESRPLTTEMRKAAADLCDAIAWAGLGKDG